MLSSTDCSLAGLRKLPFNILPMIAKTGNLSLMFSAHAVTSAKSGDNFLLASVILGTLTQYESVMMILQSHNMTLNMISEMPSQCFEEDHGQYVKFLREILHTYCIVHRIFNLISTTIL